MWIERQTDMMKLTVTQTDMMKLTVTQTDMMKLTVTFHNFSNGPNTQH